MESGVVPHPPRDDLALWCSVVVGGRHQGCGGFDLHEHGRLYLRPPRPAPLLEEAAHSLELFARRQNAPGPRKPVTLAEDRDNDVDLHYWVAGDVRDGARRTSAVLPTADRR